MRLTLDHIAVLGESLEEAVAHVETALGQPMAPGGGHARFGTHNRLLGLAPELYVEAIAVDPCCPPPKDARWFGLDHFKGPARLDKWICRVDCLDEALKALPMAGRPVRVSRGSLAWTMSVPEDGLLPFDGMFPALIEWHATVPPGKSQPDAGEKLKELCVMHPEADRLAALLTPYLDDPLIRFVQGAPGLRARIDLPNGTTELT